MSDTVSRDIVDAFFKVYSARDPDRLGAFLHDDVVWTISGPVSILSYCGTHRGKAAVLDLILRIVPSQFRFTNHVQESLLVDGDQVAMLNRRSARRTADGRVVSYRVANFMRFHNGKVIENLSLLDSFDAAEQVLGHPLAVHVTSAQGTGNIVAL